MATELLVTVGDREGGGAGLETRDGMTRRAEVVAVRHRRVAGGGAGSGVRQGESCMSGTERRVVPGLGKP